VFIKFSRKLRALSRSPHGRARMKCQRAIKLRADAQVSRLASGRRATVRQFVALRYNRLTGNGRTLSPGFTRLWHVPFALP
jgi:hypothetical protein